MLLAQATRKWTLREPELEHICDFVLVLATLLGGRCKKMENQRELVWLYTVPCLANGKDVF